MNLPSHQTFCDCLRHNFRVQIDGGSNENLVLTSVSTLLESAVSTPSHPKEHFSIIFECQNQTHLPQKIYSFTHPTVGQFELFIVPIGPDRVSKHMCYQAIFN
ncbi:hypothetical protein H8K33_11580 [Undibacterium amnicola]|uniref:DUF6916 domain-containing protein n=1 Tax=Undibacterium amnicola TaxID=1834038 RepID=A0ABR6XRN1_9BURK|nr:hypothetical protein [Undibacterium amnicola]MBC3832154.1 hypothetical protein [Undibacterium amnicola]